MGESNSPDTINSRLEGLDSGIGALSDTVAALVLGSGTSQAETIAARTGINYKSGTPPSTLSVALGYAANDNYNVRAYGAVGNGVTNDTTAVQAAINAAHAAGGGVVFLPRGTYYLTTPVSLVTCLTLYDNITLRGVGAKTILDFHGDDTSNCIDMSATTDAAVENMQIQNLSARSAASAITSSDTTARMRVRNVIIRGTTITASITNIVGSGTTVTVTAPSHGYTSGDDVYIYGTGTTGNTTTLDILLDHITVVNANTFTRTNGVSNSAVTGVAQKTSWFNGILVDGSDAIIEGCDIGTGFYTGIRVAQDCTRGRMMHNTLSLGFRGLMMDAAPGGATYCIVAHNHFYSLKQVAGKIETACTHNIVCDNIISNCSTSAYADATFEIVGPYSTFERNNMFFSGTPTSNSAIDTVTTSGHITIRDNIIEGHLGTVINIRSSMTYCEVSGNQINGGAVGISAVGSYIMIAGNRISAMTTTGITISAITAFVIQNNTIVGVTTGIGISLVSNCNYGTITGNIVYTIGSHGISQGNSLSPGQYVSIVGNVIADVGNGGTGYNISFSANAPKMTVVGNVCDDTPETSSIRGASVTSVAAIGNATQKSVTVTGTSTAVANNI